MDLNTIIEALPEEQRGEATTFLEGLNPLKEIDSKEKVLDFIDSNELFQKAKDSIISRATESYKNNHYAEDLKKAKQDIEADLKKRLKPKEETEEQKRIRELEEKIQESENQRIRTEQQNFAMQYLDGKVFKGFNPSFFLGKDVEETKENLDSFLKPYLKMVEENQKAFEERVQEEVAKKLNGSIPPAGSEGKDNLQVKYQEAIKAGDLNAAMAIKTKIAEENQTMKKEA